jgi:hypothetical protein
VTKRFFADQSSLFGISLDFLVQAGWGKIVLPLLLAIFLCGCEQGNRDLVASKSGQREVQKAGPGPSLTAPASSTAESASAAAEADVAPVVAGQAVESGAAETQASTDRPGTVQPDAGLAAESQPDPEVQGDRLTIVPAIAASTTPPATPSSGALLSSVAAAETSDSGKADNSRASLVNDVGRKDGTPLTVATEAERNQKIASDWPKPWAALFLTGQQKGYIEPCGCTGLENQKGGLNRRDTLLKSIQDRGWDVVPLDAGSQVRRQGRQAEMIFRFSADAMAKMGYRAIALGQQDLQLSSAELLQITASEGNQRTAFTSSNVSIVDPSLMNQWQVIEINQRKIGVTSVLGTSKKPDILSEEILVEDPISSLQKAMEQLRGQKCDYYVLLAHANLTESAEFARSVPGFDLVVTAGGEGEPTYLAEPIEGTKSLMVQVGIKGMYVGLVGLFDDVNNPVRYQRIALSSQFEDSPRMMEAFRGYQEHLQKLGLQRLEVVPTSHPTGRTFVGTQSCAECHTTAFDIWKDTAHAHATQSLIHPGERSDIARHFDPECLSCHVTGWNPQKFYPFESGYLSVEKTPLMMENGCENCHGPGSQHVAAENGDIEADEALLKKLREEMRLPLAQAQEKCLECHDIDNSPNFHRDGAFEEFWEQVKHYGKD